MPQKIILKNDRFESHLTPLGNGYLISRNCFLTSHRHSSDDGLFFFVRDIDSGKMWSATQAPLFAPAHSYTFESGLSSARFVRRDNESETILDIVLPPEEPCELRRLTVRNLSDVERHIEITSSVDVILLFDPLRDARHQTFSNMFIGAEFSREEHALLYHRRSFEAPDRFPFFMHRVIFDASFTFLGFETDREAFVGRNRSFLTPAGLLSPLKNTSGYILDPLAVLRLSTTIPPNGSRTLLFSNSAHIASENPHEYARQLDTPEKLEALFESAFRSDARSSLPQLEDVSPYESDQRSFSQEASQTSDAASISSSEISREEKQGGVPPPEPNSPLLFDNGFGGFDPETHAYRIRVRPDLLPPQPWSNILAHEHFGTLTTESAIGSTWFGNSKHGRLSPWSNNPVTDPPSQIVFLRRKDSNEAFSLTPAPLTKDTPEYIVTHDQGLTEYKSVHGTIRHCLRVSIDPQESVQYIDIELDHTESRSIEVECLFFLDAPETDETMSDLDSEEKGNEAERVAIRIDPNAVLLRPRFFSPNEHLKNPESVRRGALMTTSLPLEEFFLGHHHLFSLPGAGVFSPLLSHEAMRIKKGVERNDSITLSIPIVLPPQKTTRCSFSLSAASSEEALVALLPMRKEMLKHRTEKKVSIQKESVSIPPSTHRQRPSLKTPDPALNILFNTWIPYQTDASRLAAKTGFYQPGGAFGFRDQLQDVINLFFVDPERARRHILRAAREQYENGNVRSWWSPDSGFGVMSLASDHPLWLPWATLEYLRLSGSHDILEETVPFLENRPIPTGDPPVSQEEPTKYSASLLEHCLRAIRYVSERGPHGLPLMRNGDWNDGMNRVGHEKKGESVWMGFFLFSVLTRFVPILAQQGDLSLSHEFEAQAKKLKNVLNDAGWDGHWFRRAFYDDGTPLGSETNEECRIDAIAQSWSVLSGAGDPEKSSEAMENVKRFLYDPESKILKLLDPPFNDLAKKNPGYIKDYPPGIRENGSQYNHAVFWAAEASGILGDTEMVSALLECANPIRRSDSPDKARLYEVEPYVVAADIYSAEHKGKGGWTWYTASAGLLYRTILETLCGIRIDNNTMTIRPSFPREWTAVEVNVPFGSGQSIFIFEAAAPHTNIVSSATLDGTSIDPAHPFPLFRDGAIHRYKFILR